MTEIEEQQRGCQCCQGPRKPLFKMVDYDGTTEFGVFDIRINGKVKTKMTYEYCPMCGRKLGGEKDV